MSKKTANNKNNTRDNLISIVVTINHNATDVPAYLERLIQQSVANIEIILACSASRDIFAVCQHYAYKDSRIRLIAAKEKKDTAENIKNAAIEIATGQYMMFIDLDDAIKNQTLELFSQRFQNKNYDVVLFDHYVKRDATNNRLNTLLDLQLPDFAPMQEFCAKTLPEHIFNLLNNNNLPCLIKKDFLQKNKILFAPNVDYANSLFGLYVFLYAQKIIYVDTPLTIYNPIKKPTYSTLEAYKLLFEEVKKFEHILSKQNKNNALTKSFLNKILEIFWQASNIPGPQECFTKQFLYQHIFPHFNFNKSEADFYTDETCQKLVSTEYVKPVYADTLQSFLTHPQDILPIFINATYDMEVYCSPVLIQSIKQHADKHKFYDIYVLCYDKKKSVIQDNLENMSETNIRISFVTDFNDKYSPNIIFNKKHNLFIVSQMVDFYDKILFLSPSTLVRSDIAEIFDTDLSEYVFACCADIREKLKRTEQSAQKIYNSDVVLLNTKAYREKGLFSKYLECNHNATSQSILNTIGSEYIKTLNATWNVQYWNNLNEYNLNSPLLKTRGKILNFVADKPWNNPQMYLSDQWWTVARQTPFYELILYSGIRKLANIPTDFTSVEHSLDTMTPKTETQMPDGDFNQLINILDKDINNIIRKRQIQQSVYISKINNNENQVYSLMKVYIGLWFKYLISFGKNRTKIKSEMLKLQAEITKKMLQ